MHQRAIPRVWWKLPWWLHSEQGLKQRHQPQQRNKVNSNIPANEMRALKELIQLQKDRKITIKPYNKGAGIMILNFEEYLRACTSHLESTQTQPNGEEAPYYEKVIEETFKEAQDEIQQLLG